MPICYSCSIDALCFDIAMLLPQVCYCYAIDKISLCYRTLSQLDRNSIAMLCYHFAIHALSLCYLYAIVALSILFSNAVITIAIRRLLD